MSNPPRAAAPAVSQDRNFASFRRGEFRPGPIGRNLNGNPAAAAGYMSTRPTVGRNFPGSVPKDYPTGQVPITPGFPLRNQPYATKGPGTTGTDMLVTFHLYGVKNPQNENSKIHFARGEPIFVKQNDPDSVTKDEYEMFDIPGINQQVADETKIYTAQILAKATGQTTAVARARRGRDRELKIDASQFAINVENFSKLYRFLWFVAGETNASPSNVVVPDTDYTRLFEMATAGRMEDIPAFWGNAANINDRVGFAVLKTQIRPNDENISLDKFQPVVVIPVVLKHGVPFNMSCKEAIDNFLDETRDNPQVPLFIYTATQGIGPAEFSRNNIESPFAPPNTVNFGPETSTTVPSRPINELNDAFNVDFGFNDVIFRERKENNETITYPIYTFCTGKYINAGRFKYSNGTKATIRNVNEAITASNEITAANLRRMGTIELTLNV